MHNDGSKILYDVQPILLPILLSSVLVSPLNSRRVTVGIRQRPMASSPCHRNSAWTRWDTGTTDALGTLHRAPTKRLRGASTPPRDTPGSRIALAAVITRSAAAHRDVITGKKITTTTTTTGRHSNAHIDAEHATHGSLITHT